MKKGDKVKFRNDTATIVWLGKATAKINYNGMILTFLRDRLELVNN